MLGRRRAIPRLKQPLGRTGGARDDLPEKSAVGARRHPGAMKAAERRRVGGAGKLGEKTNFALGVNAMRIARGSAERALSRRDQLGDERNAILAMTQERPKLLGM